MTFEIPASASTSSQLAPSFFIFFIHLKSSSLDSGTLYAERVCGYSEAIETLLMRVVQTQKHNTKNKFHVLIPVKIKIG